MRRLWSALVAAPFLLAPTACVEEPNRLEGSIESSFDLGFETTRMVRYEDGDIQLEYLRPVSEGSADQDIVVKIVFTPPEGGIPEGAPFDLDPENDVVEHIVASEDPFPALERGQMTFEQGGNEPGPATGTFAITFTNGKTLNGAFDTTLEDVQFE